MVRLLPLCGAASNLIECDSSQAQLRDRIQEIASAIEQLAVHKNLLRHANFALAQRLLRQALVLFERGQHRVAQGLHAIPEALIAMPERAHIGSLASFDGLPLGLSACEIGLRLRHIAAIALE